MPELQEQPVNREPDTQSLVESFITVDGYERNHCMFPDINGSQHWVRVDGLVKHELNLSMADLKNDFQQHSVVCALQCAGNRRHTMRTKIKEVSGIDWLDGAVMNCKWSGPSLKDVLERAQVSLDHNDQKIAHVAFASHAVQCQEDTWYGASVPLLRALDEDKQVILALQRNDEELSKSHGYPIRVIVPGIAGARAVKWLDRITVQMKESDNHYMQYDYKALPVEVQDMESAKDYWHRVPPVQEMPINSVIGIPQSRTTVKRNEEGTVTVHGYALPSGDDGPVVKVEVSADEGSTWEDAELVHYDGESKWSWKLWRVNIKVDPGSGRAIYSKATDAAGNSQPAKSQWNLRGVCYHGYGDATELEIN